MTRSSHGGRRPGAGRPSGEPTVRMRVPAGAEPDVLTCLDDYRIQHKLTPVPVAASPKRRRVLRFLAQVPAGFPSPAEQYLEESIDLNQHLIPSGHEAATFIIRVSGWSMISAGIHDGDELVVDRAEENAIGKVVVAVHNGTMTIKRLRKRAGRLVLIAENPHYPDQVIAVGDEFSIWGVVVKVLHTP